MSVGATRPSTPGGGAKPEALGLLAADSIVPLLMEGDRFCIESTYSACFKVTEMQNIPSMFVPLVPRSGLSSMYINPSTSNSLSSVCLSSDVLKEINTGTGQSGNLVLYQLYFRYVNFPVIINVNYGGCENRYFRTPNTDYVGVTWKSKVPETLFWAGLGVQVGFTIYNPWPFPVPDGANITQLYSVLTGFAYYVEPIPSPERPYKKILMNAPPLSKTFSYTAVTAGVTMP